MSSEIEVLVVDDSAFMRKVIGELLEEDPQIKVIDKARNGVDALQKLEEYTPDVITLDVEMPKLNGLEFLKRLLGRKAIPVVMLSSVTTEGNQTTIQALELGAFDFITKPSGSISLDIDKVKEDLVKKVKLAAKSKVRTKLRRQVKRETDKEAKREKLARKRSQSSSDSAGEKLVIIGASTGGPRAVKEVLTNLPGDLEVPILVVQHMPANFTASLARRLDKTSALNVKEAEEGDRLEPGEVLVAPGGYHMLINNKQIELNQAPKVHNVRPAIDKTIGSAVKDYSGEIIGVLLTGMGKDGAKGLELIKEFGGQTIAQDESTSVVYGMPKVANELGVVDSVQPVYKISDELVTKINNS